MPYFLRVKEKTNQIYDFFSFLLAPKLESVKKLKNLEKIEIEGIKFMYLNLKRLIFLRGLM